MSNVLDLYFREGENADAIAELLGLALGEVLTELRLVGLPVSEHVNRDVATSGIKAIGYKSFHDYVSQVTSLNPIQEQAKEIGVSRHALSRLYAAYRNYINKPCSDK